jgi:hydrogenase/urease accessory protein HupE
VTTRLGRVRWALALVPLVLSLSASPAGADAARPGNVRSSVRGVEPPTTALTASIRGGDAFLRIVVAPGHEIVVYDYDDPPQPYLRVGKDGMVEENHNSKAFYQNRSRYNTEPPATLVDGAPPDWHRVSGVGVAQWHDHRVHWMARTTPPPTDWVVPLLVDGVATRITGHYQPVPAPSSAPWLAMTLVLAGAIVALARRRPTVAAVAVAAAGALALPVAVAEGHVAGQGGAAYALAVLPAAGLLAAVLALVVTRFGSAQRRPLAGALVAGAGAAVSLWAFRRLAVLHSAVLVTDVSAALDRTSVAVGLGIGLGAVAVGVLATGVISPRPTPRRPSGAAAR